MERNQSAIAFVGNPGTGKSTLLNGLVGRALFSSGISVGSGRTVNLQSHTVGKITYYDTPGLDDMERRIEAGRQIDQLLNSNVSLKLIFVVMLTKGRVRAEDAITIKIILDAISTVEQNDHFGVVVNQMPRAAEEEVKLNPFSEKLLQHHITGERSTSHWCYIRRRPELEEAENACLASPELTRFLATVPETKPVGAQVNPIDTESFQAKVERQKKEMATNENRFTFELLKQREITEKHKAAVAELSSKLQAGQKDMVERERQSTIERNKIMLDMRQQQEKLFAAQQEASTIKAEVEKVRDQAAKEVLEAQLAAKQQFIDDANDITRKQQEEFAQLQETSKKQQEESKEMLEGLRNKIAEMEAREEARRKHPCNFV